MSLPDGDSTRYHHPRVFFGKSQLGFTQPFAFSRVRGVVKGMGLQSRKSVTHVDYHFRFRSRTSPSHHESIK